MPNHDRRQFLKSTTAAGMAAFTPYYFSQPITFASEFRADRMPIGLIGAGGMGRGNIDSAKEWVDLVAIADVDEGHCQKANETLGGGKADIYKDYRKILDRDDIKIVHIATPDHWHAKPLIEAMLAGKDVYCEKPLTLTIDEGKLIRNVQKETGRIVQVGTQQRSTFNRFAKAIAVVNEGRIGKIKRIQCAIGAAPSSPALPVSPIPKGLDWDRWLGPAPAVDYRSMRKQKGQRRGHSNGHYEFRWWYEFSGGKLTDWGAHHVDIAKWALEVNGQTEGPLSIGGSAKHPVEYKDGFPLQTDRYNTATDFNFTVKFPGEMEMVIRHDTDNGVLIEGENGRIFVNRGKLVGRPIDDLKDNPLPKDAIKKIYKGSPMEKNARQAHWLNFLYCHREQVEPISDVHSHMRMLNICHLAGISARFGRDLQWDDENEVITGDDQANEFLKRSYREGYEIEMKQTVNG